MDIQNHPKCSSAHLLSSLIHDLFCEKCIPKKSLDLKNRPNGNNAPNLAKNRPIWQKFIQFDENSPNVAKNCPMWQKFIQFDEKSPNVAKIHPIWRKITQSCECVAK
jgi:hypothetical protein